jgi:hypothetical protein
MRTQNWESTRPRHHEIFFLSWRAKKQELFFPLKNKPHHVRGIVWSTISIFVVLVWFHFVIFFSHKTFVPPLPPFRFSPSGIGTFCQFQCTAKPRTLFNLERSPTIIRTKKSAFLSLWEIIIAIPKNTHPYQILLTSTKFYSLVPNFKSKITKKT